MGTINSAFSLISGALDADQSGLSILANNVANANTLVMPRRFPTGVRTRPSRSTEPPMGRGSRRRAQRRCETACWKSG